MKKVIFEPVVEVPEGVQCVDLTRLLGKKISRKNQFAAMQSLSRMSRGTRMLVTYRTASVRGFFSRGWNWLRVGSVPVSRWEFCALWAVAGAFGVGVPLAVVWVVIWAT